MIACPGCGAGMRFDPDIQKLRCDFCDTIDTARGRNGNGEAQEQIMFESTIFTCKQCGGELISDSDTAMTFCSYCGSSMVLEGRLESIKAPSRVIPFKKNREVCEESYRKLLKRSVYAPKSMRDDSVIECFRGIYMPYWVYDFSLEGTASIEGTKSYRRGDYSITDHYELSSYVNSSCEGLSFDASSNFSDSLSSAIAPYDLEDGEDFSEGFLAGFYADVSDVDSDLYYEDVMSTYAHGIGRELAAEPMFKSFSPQASSCKLEDEPLTNSYMAYFPVWFLAIRGKDSVSYAVVNGQTGKIAADIPIDYAKYILGSVLVALPVFGLLNLFFVFTPKVLLGIAIVLSLVGCFIVSGELNQLYLRDLQLDDKGVVDKKWSRAIPDIPVAEKPKLKVDRAGNKILKSIVSMSSTIFFGVVYVLMQLGDLGGNFGVICVIIAVLAGGLFLIAVLAEKTGKMKKRDSVTMKQPFSEKLGTIWKPILAIIISAVVLILHPVMDYWYYIGAVGSMFFILLSFWDLVRLHNKLTKRKPPQMNARGGAESYE